MNLISVIVHRMLIGKDHSFHEKLKRTPHFERLFHDLESPHRQHSHCSVFSEILEMFHVMFFARHICLNLKSCSTKCIQKLLELHFFYHNNCNRLQNLFDCL